MFFAVGDSCRPSAGEHAIAALSMLLFLEPRPLVRWCTRVLEQREVYRLAPHWAAPTDWRVGSDRPLDVLNEALLKARSQHKGTLAVAVHKLGLCASCPPLREMETYLKNVRDANSVLRIKALKGRYQKRSVLLAVPAAELLELSRVRLELLLMEAAAAASPPPVKEMRKPELLAALEDSQARRRAVGAQRDKLAHQLRTAAAQRAAAVAKVQAATKKKLERVRAAEAERAAAVRAHAIKAAEGVLAGRLTQLKNWRNRANARARSAEAKLDEETKKISKLRSRAVDAEHEEAALRAQVDDLVEENRGTGAEREAERESHKRVREMPTWDARRGAGAGRGRAMLHWTHRVTVYVLLALGTPASACGKAIVAVVKRAAPWLAPVEPTVSSIREMRFELRLVEEAMAARRVAAAHRVRQLGFDETTKFQDPSMVTSVLVEPTPGAALQVIILRAAYCTGGGTAELCASGIESKCFARLRQHLTGWRDTCRRLHPDHAWTGPDPELCGLQRLGGGGAFISDTCSCARKTTGLLITEVARQVKAKYDPAAWAALSEAEQATAITAHATHCWHHIRNIVLKTQSTAQSAHVKEALKEELETFAAYERMTTDFDAVLRADYKELHHGGRYHKGKGKEFAEAMRDAHPKAFMMLFERAEGGRQDLDYDASVPMYVNVLFVIAWLHPRVFSKSHSNTLEDFIYVTHCAMEYVAMMRANAAIDLLIARPWRWLAGNGSKLVNWSPYSMGDQVLERVEELYTRAASDGSVLLNPRTWDTFWKPIADTQPAFAAYLKYTYEEETVMSPDGSTRHLVYQLARRAILEPTDETRMRTRATTIEYLQVQARAGLRKMHDERTVLPSYLTSQDGALCAAKVGRAHADTIGCENTNDRFSESVFGTFDRSLKRNEGCSREAASALAHAARMKSFATGDAVRHRKALDAPSPDASLGYFHELPWQEQHALVEWARLAQRPSRAVDRADNAQYAAYVKAKAKTASQEELKALVTEWAYGMSFFERWQERGVRSVAQLNAGLRSICACRAPACRSGCTANQAKLDWLREQIEMRTRGLQWVEFAARWSSSTDEYVGTVEELTGHLKELIEHERDLRENDELPDVAPPPVVRRKTFKQLGTPTAQAEVLMAAREELTPDELREAAEDERDRLEEAGEIDHVADAQPERPPDFASLLNVHLEVRWPYRVPDQAKKRGYKTHYIWAEGEVVEIADGTTTKRTPQCKTVLAWGAVRIKWPKDSRYDEDESFTWTVLVEDSWRKEKHLGWRFAKPELARRGAAARAAKRARADTS